MTSMLPDASQPRPQKRKFQSRASQACDMCRIKKAKCDQGRPCRTCQDREFTCGYNHVSARRLRVAYPPPSRGRASQPSNKNYPSSISQPEATQEMRNIRESSTISHEHQIGVVVGPTIEMFHSSISPTGALEMDTISAINQHTSGTEFYGQSSNFVLLNQLLFKARAQLSTENGDDSSPVQHTDSTDLDPTSKMQKQSLSTKDKLVTNVVNYESTRINNAKPPSTSTSPISIVSILYDENSTMTEASPATQLTVAGRAQKPPRKIISSHQHEVRSEFVSQSRSFNCIPESNTVDTAPPAILEYRAQDTVPSSLRRANDISNAPACFFGGPMLLEAEYIELYFKNIHHIHPFLDPMTFRRRCEREIWVQRLVKELQKDQMHFVALYNAVLAIGALTAGTDLLLDFRAELENDQETGKQRKPPTSRRLSQLYFQRAKRLLGDIFEVCSIESSQTLLLMSIYCQHALRPHASYMYSGMAVRNALAIGLPSDKNSNAESVKIASKRTWWCIYSQEIEISCASGRLSSVSNAAGYQVLFPENNYTTRLDEASSNEACISIIPEIGKLSIILHQASTEIYYYPKHISLQQRSKIAIKLDKQLDSWMIHLPSWLNPNSSNLKELEWENKQKLNLTIRFYAAKMFLHRPFVTNSTTSAELSINIEACLEAAQKTITVLYDAYKHRYYVRTWWYNTTYTLYASVILLHAVLVDCTQIPTSELLQSVRNGLKVLQAMEEMDIARRSAELVGEILKVVERKVSSSQVCQAKESVQNDVFNDTSNNSGDITGAQPLDSAIFGSNFNSNGYSNFEDALNLYASDMTEVSAARDSILTELIGQEILEGFGTGFNNSILIDLEGPVSDARLGIRNEDIMFDNRNDEDSGGWSEGM